MTDEPAKLAETLDAEPYEPPKPHRGRRILLWIVAIVLLAAAAAAVPIIMPADRRANELHVIGAMRSYAEVQISRRTQAGGPGYARELPQLRGLLPGAVIAAWGSGGKPYHGYLFRELKTIGGHPLDWATDFGISAVPVKYGGVSRRSFILITNGTILGHDWGEQVDFFDDYPEDPMSSPWMYESFEDD